MSTSFATALAANPSRRPRGVMFQHVNTGRIITAHSVAEFARKARLGPLGRFHYDDVLKGKRLHNGGWGLPERLNQHLDLQDRWGNRISGTVAKLRPKLGTTFVNRLARGETTPLIAPANVPFQQSAYRTRYLGYALRAADGTIHEGRTMGEVASKAGITIAMVWLLVHGRQKRTKCGVTLHRVRKERRSALRGVVRA